MTQGRESLRPLWAVVVFAGLTAAAHASLIPNDAEVYFGINNATLSIGNGIHILRPGDALSTDGTVAISNWDLIKNFNPSSGKGTNVGLDGLQVYQWASGNGRPVVYFSTDKGFYSQTLQTQVDPGTVLNKQGQIVATNQQLVAAFDPDKTANYGLGAFDILNPQQSSQQIWFSPATAFYSDKLGQEVNPGDVLSSSGQVIATNADLLKAFNPANPSVNYGLDSLFVMSDQSSTPMIWFSTSKPFYSQTLKRTISAGDLVNNQGQVVATNNELMAKFGFRLPFDSGLDAFTMVRDMGDDSSSGRTTPPTLPEPVSVALLALVVPMVFRRPRA